MKDSQLHSTESSPKGTITTPVKANDAPATAESEKALNTFHNVDLECSQNRTCGHQGSKDEEPSSSVTESPSPGSLQKTSTAASDRPYSSFTSRQKGLIILISTLGGMFSPFTANIYFPAIDTIARSLGVSVSQVNLTITTYMIFQAIAPSFISAIADTHGRRPAYVVGFTVYMAANLGLALNNSYVGLLILRCLQSSGSSGLATLNQGTVADIVTSAERGKYISITSISSVLGPSVAPIAGGLLAAHLGWHSIFWFLLIMSGVYFFPLLLFFPETARSVVGDGSIQPPVWNRTLLGVMRDRRAKFKDSEHAEPDTDTALAEAEEIKSAAQKKQRKRPLNPLAPLSVVADPETAILLGAIGIMYAGFYAISTSLTPQFHAIYNLRTSLLGLLFLPQAVGTIFAAITNSRILDWQYRRHARRADIPYDRKRQINILTSPMPIERARLEVAIPMLAGSCLSGLVYGWLLHARVNIAGPIVMLVINGYCALAGFNVLSVLIIDLHRKRPATASAASNLVRCLLGAGASAVINPMINRLGVGWTFTLIGLLVLAVIVPSLGWVMLYGHRLRAKRAEKESRKEEEEKAREKAETQ